MIKNGVGYQYTFHAQTVNTTFHLVSIPKKCREVTRNCGVISAINVEPHYRRRESKRYAIHTTLEIFRLDDKQRIANNGSRSHLNQDSLLQKKESSQFYRNMNGFPALNRSNLFKNDVGSFFRNVMFIPSRLQYWH